MGYFKPMLTDKSLSMCQDVTPNTAEAKMMMYAICWNETGTRMLQVGIEPKRLMEELRTNSVREMMQEMPSSAVQKPCQGVRFRVLQRAVRVGHQLQDDQQAVMSSRP